jgi:hypothetical protein
MEKKDQKSAERPEAYPKPSSRDNQFGSQPEFLEEKPNDFEETSSRHTPTSDNNEATPDKNLDD